MIVFHIDLKHKHLLDILFYLHINNHFFSPCASITVLDGAALIMLS